jgi:hypothetical protein
MAPCKVSAGDVGDHWGSNVPPARSIIAQGGRILGLFIEEVPALVLCGGAGGRVCPVALNLPLRGIPVSLLRNDLLPRKPAAGAPPALGRGGGGILLAFSVRVG